MKLKEFREHAGLLQIDLAAKAGVSQGAISQYENGSNQPSVEVAKRIAEVLSFDWTLFFEDPA